MTTPPTPPAGWYPDPTVPGQQRWWNGTSWSKSSTMKNADAPIAAASTASPFAVQPPAATPSTALVAPAPGRGPRTGIRGWRPTVSTWIVGAVAIVLMLIGALTGGLGGLLTMLALVVLGAGLWTLVTRRPSWLNLPRSRGAGGIAVVAAVALLVIGSVASPRPAIDQAGPEAETIPLVAVATPTATSTPKPTDTPKPTPTRTATPTPRATPTPTPTPVTSVMRVDTTEAVSYALTSVDDPVRAAGETAIVVAGVNGVKTSTWDITLVDGVETGRTLVSEAITTAPVDEVKAIGSYVPAPVEPAPAAPSSAYYANCDAVRAAGAAPLYASDPGYSRKLDRDGDGVACE